MTLGEHFGSVGVARDHEERRRTRMVAPVGDGDTLLADFLACEDSVFIPARETRAGV